MVDLDKIAQNTTFSDRGLHLRVENARIGKNLAINYEEIFALWANIMNRDYLEIKISNNGEEGIIIPASIANKRQKHMINPISKPSNILWFANVAITPNILAIANDLMENPRKAGVTRLSDERQIIMSDACKILNPGHTMQEATNWNRSDFWHPQDLIDFRRECQQTLSPDGSNTLEFTWRSFDPALGLRDRTPGNWIKFTTKYRLFDGEDGDFYQLCENLGMEEMVQIPSSLKNMG